MIVGGPDCCRGGGHCGSRSNTALMSLRSGNNRTPEPGQLKSNACTEGCGFPGRHRVMCGFAHERGVCGHSIVHSDLGRPSCWSPLDIPRRQYDMDERKSPCNYQNLVHQLHYNHKSSNDHRIIVRPISRYQARSTCLPGSTTARSPSQTSSCAYRSTTLRSWARVPSWSPYDPPGHCHPSCP